MHYNNIGTRSYDDGEWFFLGESSKKYTKNLVRLLFTRVIEHRRVLRSGRISRLVILCFFTKSRYGLSIFRTNNRLPTTTTRNPLLSYVHLCFNNIIFSIRCIKRVGGRFFEFSPTLKIWQSTRTRLLFMNILLNLRLEQWLMDVNVACWKFSSFKNKHNPW